MSARNESGRIFVVDSERISIEEYSPLTKLEMPQLASGAISSKDPRCQSGSRRPRRRYIIVQGDTRLAQRWLADAQDQDDRVRNLLAGGLPNSSEMLSEEV